MVQEMTEFESGLCITRRPLTFCDCITHDAIVNPEQSGETALMIIAGLHNNEKVLRVLVEFGEADVNVVTPVRCCNVEQFSHTILRQSKVSGSATSQRQYRPKPMNESSKRVERHS